MKLAIDIGGTFIKWGLIDNSEIIENGKFPTEALEIEGAGIVKKIAHFANEMNEKHGITKVGISIPGATNSQTKTIVGATQNIPGSQWLNVGEVFAEVCGIETYVGNDVNNALLGELEVGALKGKKDALMITLGTGIGGALLIEGELYEGHSAWAGEVGRMIVKGQKWEHTASTSSLLKAVKEATGNEISGEEFYSELATNVEYQRVYDEYLDSLAIGLVNVMSTLNPDLIVLGGGITESESFMIEDIVEHISKYIPKELVEITEIVKAKTGNKAALFGSVSD